TLSELASPYRVATIGLPRTDRPITSVAGAVSSVSARALATVPTRGRCIGSTVSPSAIATDTPAATALARSARLTRPAAHPPSAGARGARARLPASGRTG